MRCPYCSHRETKVTNKRDNEDTTRRRRECLKCNKRFTTVEEVVSVGFSVIKKDGTKEPFNIEKLRSGVEKACEKLPIKEESEKMITNIVNKLEKKGRDVRSSEIGTMVMAGLKKLDDVAYIRFTCHHKEFKNVGDFKKIIMETAR